MGLLDGYSPVTGSYVLKIGTPVVFLLDYFSLPLTAPGAEEWTRALEENCDLAVTRIEDAGTGSVVYGTIIDEDLTAAEFTDEVRTAIQVLNQNRAVPVLNGQVVGLSVPDNVAPNAGSNTAGLGGLGFGLGLGVVLIVGLLIVLAVRR